MRLEVTRVKDIVEELRAMAKLWEERKASWDETTLLHSAAAEIERLRKAEGTRLRKVTAAANRLPT